MPRTYRHKGGATLTVSDNAESLRALLDSDKGWEEVDPDDADIVFDEDDADDGEDQSNDAEPAPEQAPEKKGSSRAARKP